MLSGFRILRVAGISLELHASFLILITLMIVFLGFTDPASLFSTLVFVFILFASVLLHELAHALVARFRKIRVEKIILFPIGGMAVSKQNPSRPLDEFLIAVAGPAFNFMVVLGVLFFVSVYPQTPFFPAGLLENPSAFPVDALSDSVLKFPLMGLLWVNLMLGVFNLFVPAFPMDGGRILRAMLSAWMGGFRGTVAACHVSQVISILMIFWGLFSGGLMLALIGGFIFLAASQEKNSAQATHVLGNATIESIIRKNAWVLGYDSRVSEARSKMMELNEPALLVETGPNAFGMIFSEQLEKETNLVRNVREIAQSVPFISVQAPAREVLNFFNASELEAIAVQSGGQPAGFVFREDLEKLFKLLKLNKN
ncbi:MAG: site-2 protease family protein [Candidatus Diapherotrites archaeon]|nr:site-2 protease family protein [Candidatus Diapherotrites archaeon]